MRITANLWQDNREHILGSLSRLFWLWREGKERLDEYFGRKFRNEREALIYGLLSEEHLFCKTNELKLNKIERWKLLPKLPIEVWNRVFDFLELYTVYRFEVDFFDLNSEKEEEIWNKSSLPIIEFENLFSSYGRIENYNYYEYYNLVQLLEGNIDDPYEKNKNRLLYLIFSNSRNIVSNFASLRSNGSVSSNRIAYSFKDFYFYINGYCHSLFQKMNDNEKRELINCLLIWWLKPSQGNFDFQIKLREEGFSNVFETIVFSFSSNFVDLENLKEIKKETTKLIRDNFKDKIEKRNIKWVNDKLVGSIIQNTENYDYPAEISSIGARLTDYRRLERKRIELEIEKKELEKELGIYLFPAPFSLHFVPSILILGFLFFPIYPKNYFLFRKEEIIESFNKINEESIKKGNVKKYSLKSFPFFHNLTILMEIICGAAFLFLFSLLNFLLIYDFWLEKIIKPGKK